MTLALTAFENRNVSQTDAMKRMYMMASGRMPTLVIRNTPFTAQEVKQRHELMRKFGFHKLFYLPHGEEILTAFQETNPPSQDTGTFDPVFVRLATGEMTLQQLVAGAEVDLSPVTDDRPFF
ncbi:hypothetical protein MJD09_16950, partial [bacterium]|nr:hypothetical protein [bacterium]